MIILELFFSFSHKDICCGYSLELPDQGTLIVPTTYVFMEILSSSFSRGIVKGEYLVIIMG